MPKIKKNIDLKILEKFGYEDMGVCYRKYGYLKEQYYINKKTREIKRLHPYSFREIPTFDEILDLVQADLVDMEDK